MERRKSYLRWYWFLEWEVRLAATLGVGTIIIVLLFDTPNLMFALGVLVVLAMEVVGTYQKRLCERMGADRVRSPRLFGVFWRVVAAIEVMLLVALLLRALKPLIE
jgi:hypothetical protein